ncbi:Cys/Met metabolism PLP-dependent enzyme-domain-containing protein [Mycena galopus ATCC 62051]|nr:Cys/Met metabolism PLP-dependent enzyme-domain-containing protein [Mycena galopus ATCC 62051]
MGDRFRPSCFVLGCFLSRWLRQQHHCFLSSFWKGNPWSSSVESCLNFYISQTYNQFKVVKFTRYGVTAKFLTSCDPTGYATAIDEKTKAIYVKSIPNSDTILADIAGLAKLTINLEWEAIWFVLSPLAPISWVLHSATKWIIGNGTTMAGVIIDSGNQDVNFDWRKSDKFPMINSPSAAHDNFPLAEGFFPLGFAVQVRIENLRDLGPCLSAQSAFTALLGVETPTVTTRSPLPSMLSCATYTSVYVHPRVISVNYLGLPPHPSHQLALKTLDTDAFGGILSFRMEGGFEKMQQVINNLKLASHLANIGAFGFIHIDGYVGDAKTLVIAPFVTTQSQLTVKAPTV